MAETHDTIDSLLAEFRGYSAFMPPSYHVTMSWHDFRRMLDRFEAAHKREAVTDCNQFGNAAKLREALKAIGGLCAGLMPTWDGAVGRIKDMAETALAAPPRNCDVIGNTGRALLVHGFPTKSNQWGEGEWLEFIDWLLAPATEKEGGAE